MPENQLRGMQDYLKYISDEVRDFYAMEVVSNVDKST